ncbi:MAG TPA: serine hydrolase domain-containing protein [Myxococcota bacterium]|nr:serine hydrolase domain-containing protein [Myxococcota bacterium]
MNAFAKQRLARLHAVMAGFVERGELPGVVTVLARGDEVHVDAIGALGLGGREPMRRDTIFRITSMTKPITAAAALILVEECRLRLDDPVDPWLPELANRRVLRRPDGPLDDTVPAARPISLRDLLTFRLGLGMIVHSEPWPIQVAERELGIPGFGPPDVASPHDPDEWMRRLGTLPLMHQPGAAWQYGLGSYVLGVLIARASGRPLEAFLCERIFEPLGMRDTSFAVPAAKLPRLASSYWVDAATGGLTLHDDPKASAWARPPAFPDGGAGLVSTADDYLAFARMLLEWGRHGSERILSRAAVETMTADQLTPEQRRGPDAFGDFFASRGFGFGVAVQLRRDDLWTTPGRYGWDGGYGTSWANDPREGLVAIQLTQRAGFPGTSAPYVDFWTSVYQALDD